MDRKSIIGAVVGLLLLTAIIGANLVMAGGRHDEGRSVRNQEATPTTTTSSVRTRACPPAKGR